MHKNKKQSLCCFQTSGFDFPFALYIIYTLTTLFHFFDNATKSTPAVQKSIPPFLKNEQKYKKKTFLTFSER